MLTPDQRRFLHGAMPHLPADGWQASHAGHAGSQRHFLRVAQPGLSLILMVWDSADPDWPRCLGIHDALAGRTGLLPRIHARDAALGLILEEDLGGTTLKLTEAEPGLANRYAATLTALAEWQRLDTAAPILQARVMDRDGLLWESAYFAEHLVAGHCGRADLLTPAWEAERQRLAATVDAMPKVWMHRDFQSENIMLHDGRIRFVDYQGARLGPAAYDAASLLGDPYVEALTSAFTEPLLAAFRRQAPVPFSEHDYRLCAAQRLMQALGAYGNLARNKGKPRYLAFIPTALNRLSRIAAALPGYPVLNAIVAACRFREV